MKFINDDGTDCTPEDIAREYYRDKLIEQELLKKAVLLDVKAVGESLAVPVGKFRLGGHLEFHEKREARKALRSLAKRRGFPNARVIAIPFSEEGSQGTFWQVRWGAPPPFNGSGQEVSCNILLGIYYGYGDEAIAEHANARLRSEGRSWGDMNQMLRFIRAARHPL
jgi:hypothetical protein